MRNPQDNYNNNKHRNAVIFLVIILLLVVLMSAFLVLRCLTFDENGAHVVDRYGVLAMEGSGAGLVDYSQFTGGSAADTAAKSTDSEEQEKTTDTKAQTDTTAPQEIRAVTVSAKDLTYDDDYRNQLISLKDQGLLDTVIVDLKNSEGWLCTGVTTSAVDTSLISADYADDFPTAIAEIKQAGIRVIGRIYCFRDDMATRQNSDLSCWYDAAGTNWLDADNHRWLDPTDSSAVQYLCDIVSAGAKAGCDELVLSEFCFPQGQTDLISFDQDLDFSTAIQSDLKQLTQAAGTVPVSLWMTATVSEAMNQGQDLSALYGTFSRVFVTDDNAGVLSGLSDGGAKGVTVYSDRTAWQSTTGSAVFDTNEDMYQVFYIK